MTPLRSLLLVGAIGGIVGTAAMTAAMRRLYRLLPAEEHYPLPPRELTERIVPAPSPDATADRTLAAHFGFGAAAGALMSAAGGLRPGRGAVMGPAVWLLSYLGWVPATGLLRPATSHPAKRNALMIAVHVVWGVTTALTARELLPARQTIFAPGPKADR